MNITWKTSNMMYVSGVDAYLGKWKVGTIFYDGVSPKDDVKDRVYKATCSLPGIKEYLGNYVTTDEARQKVEAAIVHWIKEANLREIMG